MSISRKNQAPVGITNTSGEPEIVLELNGLVLSMKPPATDDPAIDDPAIDDPAANDSEAEAAGDLGDE